MSTRLFLEWSHWPTFFHKILALLAVSLAAQSGVCATTTLSSFDHTLALKSDGTVVAWGNGGSGVLGARDPLDAGSLYLSSSTTPVAVSVVSDVVSVSASRDHNLVLKKDGTVWAWGSSRYGQLGTGQFNISSYVPVQVPGLANVVAISAGENFSAAVTADGSVWTWGRNKWSSITYGMLGNTGPDSATPTKVSGVSGVKAVAASQAFMLALKTDGTVWAWGRNNRGQLGNGVDPTTTPPIGAPAPVLNLTGITAIAASFEFSMALKSDGTVWVWGDDYYGQLGNGLPVMVPGVNYVGINSVPKKLSALSDVAAISAGLFNAAAVKTDGTVWTWGINSWGQLGLGTTTQPAVAVNRVPGLSNVTSIAFGNNFVVAGKSDGSVWSWGKNSSFGALGNGSTTDSSVPVQVLGTNAVGFLSLLAGSTTSQPDCLFSWAEANFPAFFAPAAAQSQSAGPYYYRYYAQTAAYLAVASDRVLYLGPQSGNTVLDLGLASSLYAAAGCR